LFSVLSDKFEKDKDPDTNNAGSSSLSGLLNERGWNFSLGGLDNEIKVSDVKPVKKYDHNVDSISSSLGQVKINIERISSADDDFYRLYFKDKGLFIESSYVKSLSAYPDIITNTIECPDEYKPEKYEKNGKDIEILSYVFLTNDRFNYGICSSDLITHKGIMISAYCPESHDLYDIKLLIPIDQENLNYKNIIENIKCKRG